MLGLIGSLSTQSQKVPGFPFGSMMPYAADNFGRPIFFVSSMAMHTHNLRQDPRASLLYLSRYENAKYWQEYSDFAYYRLQVSAVYFIGGFGVMGWISAEDYRSASPDPLASAAAGIIRHMNNDHADALRLIARRFAGEESDEAAITAVDRLGFHLRLKSGERIHGTRVAFLREVKNTEEARAVFVEMVRQA